MKYGSFLNITSIHYVPKPIPSFIKFVPFSNMWNDQMIKMNELYIFIDASVNYSKNDNDPRSNIQYQYSMARN